MNFYNRLNYSLGNEDWNIEKQALRITPLDRTLCITGSGDRPLHLLMTDCAEVISIDKNPIQNYLLDLKKTAIAHLPYHDYLAFLGCTPSSTRFATFMQIKMHLTEDAALYWENNKNMLERGVIYQGKIERLIGVAAKCFNLVRRKKIDALFSFTDLESQQTFLKKEWDTLTWRSIFEIFLNSHISKIFSSNHIFNAPSCQNIKPGKYIYQRMLTYLNNNLAKNSPLLQQILKGKISSESYYPYLTFDGYNKIRQNLSKLKFHTCKIVDYLNDHPNSFDCFSMSDIASYMPQAAFENLLNGIHTAAKPKARFCIREFISRSSIPQPLLAHVIRNPELELKLETEESNFVYRFFVGDIHK